MALTGQEPSQSPPVPYTATGGRANYDRPLGRGLQYRPVLGLSEAVDYWLSRLPSLKLSSGDSVMIQANPARP